MAIEVHINHCSRHGSWSLPVKKFNSRRSAAFYLRREGYKKIHDDGTWFDRISQRTAAVRPVS